MELFPQTVKDQKFELRDYQLEAVAAIEKHLEERDDNPCVVVPTGGGKTPIIAVFAKRTVEMGGRLIILAHVKELLEQTAERICEFAPELVKDFGIYSASLKRRDTRNKVIIGGIQSVYRRPEAFGEFDAVLVDEAHRIPFGGEGMYLKFIDAAKKVNPDLRVVGLTATPYRTDHGMVCGPTNILNKICYEVDIPKLIRKGFLCPVTTKGGKKDADLSKVRKVMGEFHQGELGETMADQELVQATVKDLLKRTKERESVLIFATSIVHAKMISEALKESGQSVAEVFGKTHQLERGSIVKDFKNGEIKYLVNVNVLTLGFDAPNVDCVALVRPTLSPGLFYQMVGRGFRLYKNKSDCLVLDYAGNTIRHGPVDAIRINKRGRGGAGSSPDAAGRQCPKCDEIVKAATRKCGECGFEFPKPEFKHSDKAGEGSILSNEPVKVYGVRHEVHTKIGADEWASKSMKVSYCLTPIAKRSNLGMITGDWISEWVCLEHDGYAYTKAVNWWRMHTNAPLPGSAGEAVKVADEGHLRNPVEICYKYEGKYPRITKRIFDESVPKPGSDLVGKRQEVTKDDVDVSSDDFADEFFDKFLKEDWETGQYPDFPERDYPD